MKHVPKERGDQRQMIEHYVKAFKGGSIKDHKESQRCVVGSPARCSCAGRFLWFETHKTTASHEHEIFAWGRGTDVGFARQASLLTTELRRTVQVVDQGQGASCREQHRLHRVVQVKKTLPPSLVLARSRITRMLVLRGDDGGMAAGIRTACAASSKGSWPS